MLYISFTIGQISLSHYYEEFDNFYNIQFDFFLNANVQKYFYLLIFTTTIVSKWDYL